MTNYRTLVGIGLTTVTLTCLYLGYATILYIAISLAVAYDSWYMLIIHGCPLLATSVFFFIMELFNFLLVQLYYYNAIMTIKIITIAQISDVFQFIAGTRLGRNKIGWISKNKTLEGYLVGWLLTVCANELAILMLYISGASDSLILLLGGIYEISAIYLLGVIGGLCSSLFKRILNIKDYSNLLGPHGGWVDRVDSIILPTIAFWLGFI